MPDSLLQGKTEVVPRRRQPTVTDAVLLVGITFGVLLMLREVVRVLSWPLLLGISVLLSIVVAYGYGLFSRRWRKERRAERVAAGQHVHRTKTDETARETESDAESITESPVNSKSMIEQAEIRSRNIVEQAQEAADPIRAEAEQERAAVLSESEQVRDEFREGLLDDLGRVHGEISGLLERTRKQLDQARMETAQPTEQATTRRQELESYIDALRDFERGYRSRLRGFVESQIAMLQDIAPYESIAGPQADEPTEPMRAFAHEYRARLQGFVEGQLKALQDAAPSGPVAPPPPPGAGGTSQPPPGAEDLPPSTGSRQSSYSALRESTLDQLGENGRDKVDRPREK